MRDRVDKLHEIAGFPLGPDIRFEGKTPYETITVSPIREFETGATRDTDKDKHDPEGFLSPAVIKRFNEYMHKNRIQSNGKYRDSDNWQKGIPPTAYMKSGWRHFLDWWTWHRMSITTPYVLQAEQYERVEEILCAVMFNAMGYLHEAIKAKKEAQNRIPQTEAFIKEARSSKDQSPFF